MPQDDSRNEGTAADQPQGGQQAPSGPRIASLEDLVEVDGQRIPLSQVLAAVDAGASATAELESLRAYRDAAQAVMFPGDAREEELRASARVVFAEAGYSGADLERQVSGYVAGILEEQPEEDPQARGAGRPGKSQSQEEGNEMDPAMKAQIEAAREDARIARRRLIEQELDASVAAAIDKNQDLAKMMMQLDRVRGRDNARAAYESVQEQIRQATVDRLTERRAQSGGAFKEEWIAEEAAKAAASVEKSYSAVIGDYAQIGRAPETDGGSDGLSSRQPVKEPEFTPSDNRSTVDSKVNEWAADALTRAAAETVSSAATKA